MPQQLDSIDLDLQVGDQRQHRDDGAASRRTPSGGSGRAAARASAAARSSGSFRRPAFASRARNSSNSSACADELVAPRRPGPSTRNSSRSDNRHDGSRPTIGAPRGDVRRERLDHAARLALRLVDQAGGEIGAAAAQRAVALRVARRGARDRDAIARRLQHAQRRVRVLRLEVVVEGVDEQHDVRRVDRRGLRRRAATGRCRRATAAACAAPTAQRCARTGAPRPAARRAGWRRTGSARPTAPSAAASRSAGPSASARAASASGAANSIFIFAMSTPVGQSRLQPLQLTHRSSASRTASVASASVPSWPDSASRSVLARPRVEVLLVARDAVARAHRAGVELAAVAVVVAHLDGLGEAAPDRRRCPARSPARSPDRPARSTPTSRARCRASPARSRAEAEQRCGRPSSCRGRSCRGSSGRRDRTASLTSSNARVSRGPNCHATHSVRTRPSPCSPEYAPLYSRTSAAASSAIARIFARAVARACRGSAARAACRPTRARTRCRACRAARTPRSGASM